MLEVHCEKRDFGGDIRRAEPRCELEAVEEANAAAVDADARSVQVTMTVAHASVGHAPFEQSPVCGEKLIDVAPDVCVDVVLHRSPYEGAIC